MILMLLPNKQKKKKPNNWNTAEEPTDSYSELVYRNVQVHTRFNVIILRTSNSNACQSEY